MGSDSESQDCRVAEELMMSPREESNILTILGRFSWRVLFMSEYCLRRSRGHIKYLIYSTLF